MRRDAPVAGQRGDDLGGVIGRTIIHHQDCEVAIRLREAGTDGFADEAGSVVAGDDDAVSGVHAASVEQG